MKHRAFFKTLFGDCDSSSSSDNDEQPLAPRDQGAKKETIATVSSSEKCSRGKKRSSSNILLGDSDSSGTESEIMPKLSKDCASAVHKENHHINTPNVGVSTQCTQTESTTCISESAGCPRNLDENAMLLKSESADTDVTTAIEITSQPRKKESSRGVPMFGWVSQPEDIDAVSFVTTNLPSTWTSDSVHWISISSPEGFSKKSKASGRNPWVGKWLWFVDPASVDATFLSVADCLQAGNLGSSAKVATKPMGGRHVICIYTENFMDAEDVLRVGREVRRLGASNTISYKPDVFTLSDAGIYGNNSLPKSIYQLRKGETCLTFTVTKGKRDVTVAEGMALKEVAKYDT